MPSLILFGRLWRIGSDDLVFPPLTEAFINVIWLFCIILVWATESAYFDCDQGSALYIYFGGVVAILALIVAANLVLVRHSMKGTIMDFKSRKHVPKILYMRISLIIPQTAWNILGSISIPQEFSCQGSSKIITVFKGLVIFNWILFVMLLIAVVIMFDPFGGYHGTNSSVTNRASYTANYFLSKQKKVWRTRCKCLCCSWFPGCFNNNNTREDDVFEDVANVLATLFLDIDLVVSDIAAGLILLREENKNQRNIRKCPTTDSLDVTVNATSSNNASISMAEHVNDNSADNDRSYCLQPIITTEPENGYHIQPNWMTSSTAATYFKYAFGTYGWKLQLYKGFWKGILRLRKQIICCASLRRTQSSYDSDNCCACNTAAIKSATSLTDSDIYYVSFHNRIYEVPFYVAVDHQTSAIVVAIRGTLSLDDALTDLTAVNDLMCTEELSDNCRAHKGILNAARFVYQRIKEERILDNVFVLYPTYHLVITGHSLGAGTAVLLTMLLKCRYPNIRCVAYSPPGELLSLNAAQFTESFCMSVVVGDDIIPRLSLTNLEKLKYQLIDQLHSCRSPKYVVLLRGFYRVLLKCCPFLPNDTTVFGSSCLCIMPRSVSNSNHSRSNFQSEQLYLPGKILHIDRELYTDNSSSSYVVGWKAREDFNSIIISHYMMKDHFPDQVEEVLNTIMQGKSV